MKKRYYLFILIFSITANAQELVINNAVYGQVTSTFYKEARVVRRITPAQFHELSVLYDGYRLNFKNDVDYSACFSSYPKTIEWELTEEELRNLRNFIRRNGGDLPKTRIREAISPDEDNADKPVTVAVDEHVEVAFAVTEEILLTNTEAAEEFNIINLDPTNKDSTTWISLANDLDTTQLIEIIETSLDTIIDFSPGDSVSRAVNRGDQKIEQMRAYKRKGVIYGMDTLSVKEAKLIAMNQNFTAYRHFAAAQRIRGWNTFWGIVTVPAYPIVIITGPAIAIRESIRKRKIEQAVEAYNISILKANNRDIKTLIR